MSLKDSFTVLHQLRSKVGERAHLMFQMTVHIYRLHLSICHINIPLTVEGGQLLRATEHFEHILCKVA